MPDEVREILDALWAEDTTLIRNWFKTPDSPQADFLRGKLMEAYLTGAAEGAGRG